MIVIGKRRFCRLSDFRKMNFSRSSAFQKSYTVVNLLGDVCESFNGTDLKLIFGYVVPVIGWVIVGIVKLMFPFKQLQFNDYRWKM